jgi:hypothetical protein
MAREAADKLSKGPGQGHGSLPSEGSEAGKGKQPFKGAKKLSLYSDDKEELVVRAGVDAVDAELARYWMEENEEKMDVIDWWKVNEVRYPILAMVARRNLAV